MSGQLQAGGSDKPVMGFLPKPEDLTRSSRVRGRKEMNVSIYAEKANSPFPLPLGSHETHTGLDVACPHWGGVDASAILTSSGSSLPDTPRNNVLLAI